MKFRHGHGFRRSLSAAGTALAALFEAAGLSLDVALTARDADVINAYVRIGLGIGILACVAIDSTADTDLVAVETSHLFESHTSWIGFRRGSVLRAYMYDSKRRMS